VALRRLQLLARTSGRVTPEMLSTLDRLFRTFIGVYQRAKAAAERAEQQAAELYRFKERAVEIKSEEEEAQEEIAAMYPDYAADFEDIVGKDAKRLAAEEEAKEKAAADNKRPDQARRAAAEKAIKGMLHLLLARLFVGSV
jgi:hypothetical protein